jgi:SAM-dependent methyltransferase
MFGLLPSGVKNAVRNYRAVKDIASRNAAMQSTIERIAAAQNATQRDVDALYRVLYEKVHDRDAALDLSSDATRKAFSSQWSEHETGNYLLSDPWFKGCVDRILVEEELQISPEWFRGKKVLDAGCGNGRWAYGLLKLGVDLTCVDINESAIEKTREAISELGDASKDVRFMRSSLEDVAEVLNGEKFDLVFSWGVIHHCHSYNRAFDAISSLVVEGGLIYLYLYGRESLPLPADLRAFAERVYYNSLPDAESKMHFLMEKAGDDPKKVHNAHDVYAPLINRRLTFSEVESRLRANGFTEITRTIQHREIFVRAIKGTSADMGRFVLEQKKPPYWFQHH